MIDLSTPAGSLLWLREVAAGLSARDGGACARLLDDPKFRLWPGSPAKHHVWEGGLAQHTAQVCMAAMGMCDAAEHSGKPMDRDVVACAAIFHDAGKIHDYAPDPMGTGGWVKTPHCTLVHHLVRSAEMWNREAQPPAVDGAFALQVTHCILAHHGRREWGAAVVPATREAWCVHLADMSSVQCVEVRRAGPE